MLTLIISLMSIKNSYDDHQKNEIDIKFDRKFDTVLTIILSVVIGSVLYNVNYVNFNFKVLLYQ